MTRCRFCLNAALPGANYCGEHLCSCGQGPHTHAHNQCPIRDAAPELLAAVKGLVLDVERGAARVTTAGNAWLRDMMIALARAEPGTRCRCGRPFTVERRSTSTLFLECERRYAEIGHDSVAVGPSTVGLAPPDDAVPRDPQGASGPTSDTWHGKGYPYGD